MFDKNEVYNALYASLKADNTDLDGLSDAFKMLALDVHESYDKQKQRYYQNGTMSPRPLPTP